MLSWILLYFHCFRWGFIVLFSEFNRYSVFSSILHYERVCKSCYRTSAVLIILQSIGHNCSLLAQSNSTYQFVRGEYLVGAITIDDHSTLADGRIMEDYVLLRNSGVTTDATIQLEIFSGGRTASVVIDFVTSDLTVRYEVRDRKIHRVVHGQLISMKGEATLEERATCTISLNGSSIRLAVNNKVIDEVTYFGDQPITFVESRLTPISTISFEGIFELTERQLSPIVAAGFNSTHIYIPEGVSASLPIVLNIPNPTEQPLEVEVVLLSEQQPHFASLTTPLYASIMPRERSGALVLPETDVLMKEGIYVFQIVDISGPSSTIHQKDIVVLHVVKKLEPSFRFLPGDLRIVAYDNDVDLTASSSDKDLKKSVSTAVDQMTITNMISIPSGARFHLVKGIYHRGEDLWIGDGTSQDMPQILTFTYQGEDDLPPNTLICFQQPVDPLAGLESPTTDGISSGLFTVEQVYGDGSLEIPHVDGGGFLFIADGEWMHYSQWTRLTGQVLDGIALGASWQDGPLSDPYTSNIPEDIICTALQGPTNPGSFSGYFECGVPFDQHTSDAQTINMAQLDEWTIIEGTSADDMADAGIDICSPDCLACCSDWQLVTVGCCGLEIQGDCAEEYSVSWYYRDTVNNQTLPIDGEYNMKLDFCRISSLHGRNYEIQAKISQDGCVDVWLSYLINIHAGITDSECVLTGGLIGSQASSFCTPLAYTWYYVDDGQSYPLGDSMTFNPIQDGYYQVNVSYAGEDFRVSDIYHLSGCTRCDLSAEVTITSNVSPNIVCMGGIAEIQIEVSSDLINNEYEFSWPNQPEIVVSDGDHARAIITPTETSTYEALITDWFGCSLVKSFTIEMWAGIIDGGLVSCTSTESCGPFTPDPIVPHEEVTYDGDMPINYQWQYFIAGQSSSWVNIVGATSASYQHGKLSQSTKFRRVAFEDICGTQAVSNEWNIEIYPEPNNVELMYQVNQGTTMYANNSPIVMCSGQALVLSAISDRTYNWSWIDDQGGIYSLDDHVSFFDVQSSFSGMLSARTNDGCTLDIPYNVSVNQSPQVQIIGENTCSGVPTILETAVSGGTAPYAYDWSNGDTTSIITVEEEVTTRTEFTIELKVTDQLGCVSKVEKTIVIYGQYNTPGLSMRVGSDPVVPVQSQMIEICSGMDLKVYADLKSEYDWTWYREGGEPVTPGYVLELDNVSLSHTGSYYALGVDKFNCEVILPISVVMEEFTGQVDIIGEDYCLGGQSQISTVVTGDDGPYTYKWFTGESSPNIVVSESEIGIYEYFVVITNAEGCSETFSYPVNTYIDFAVDIYGPPSVCLDIGDDARTDITFIASVPNEQKFRSDFGVSSSYTYLWSDGGTGQLHTVLISDDHAVDQFTISVVVTDTVTGCISISDHTVPLLYNPLVQIENLPELCGGLTVQIGNVTQSQSLSLSISGDQTYTYNLDISSNQSEFTLTDIESGGYFVSGSWENDCPFGYGWIEVDDEECCNYRLKIQCLNDQLYVQVIPSDKNLTNPDCLGGTLYTPDGHQLANTGIYQSVNVLDEGFGTYRFISHEGDDITINVGWTDGLDCNLPRVHAICFNGSGDCQIIQGHCSGNDCFMHFREKEALEWCQSRCGNIKYYVECLNGNCYQRQHNCTNCYEGSSLQEAMTLCENSCEVSPPPCEEAPCNDIASNTPCCCDGTLITASCPEDHYLDSQCNCIEELPNCYGLNPCNETARNAPCCCDGIRVEQGCSSTAPLDNNCSCNPECYNNDGQAGWIWPSNGQWRSRCGGSAQNAILEFIAQNGTFGMFCDECCERPVGMIKTNITVNGIRYSSDVKVNCLSGTSKIDVVFDCSYIQAGDLLRVEVDAFPHPLYVNTFDCHLPTRSTWVSNYTVTSSDEAMWASCPPCADPCFGYVPCDGSTPPGSACCCDNMPVDDYGVCPDGYKWSGCECTEIPIICNVNESPSGGNGGADITYPGQPVGTRLNLVFDPISVPDSIELWIGTSRVMNSGAVSKYEDYNGCATIMPNGYSNSHTISTDQANLPIRVMVGPNVCGTNGTGWSYRITCGNNFNNDTSKYKGSDSSTLSVTQGDMLSIEMKFGTKVIVYAVSFTEAGIVSKSLPVLQDDSIDTSSLPPGHYLLNIVENNMEYTYNLQVI